VREIIDVFAILLEVIGTPIAGVGKVNTALRVKPKVVGTV